jgi:hypothetical protein
MPPSTNPCGHLTTGSTSPYEWRCDMSHVTANVTSTANIVMNMTQRVHILPTIRYSFLDPE